MDRACFEKGRPLFEPRICSCGTIHFIPNLFIDEALIDGRNLLWICAHCGSAILIGGDKTINEFAGPGDPEFGYMMYSHDMNLNRTEPHIVITQRTFETTEDRKGIEKIFYSNGIRVPMMTGYYARYYDHANRYFQDTWYPDWDKIVSAHTMSLKDVVNNIEDYRKKSRQIDMRRFVNQTEPKYLNILVNTFTGIFDWTGTEYEIDHKEYLDRIQGIAKNSIHKDYSQEE